MKQPRPCVILNEVKNLDFAVKLQSVIVAYFFSVFSVANKKRD